MQKDVILNLFKPLEKRIYELQKKFNE